MLGVVMDFFVQTFQWNFGLFHDVQSKVDIRSFKVETFRA